ncbi:MAG: 50S ribosomal protein L25/general stress protein Ctc [Candidatus Saccharimonadales bacterium]
MSEDNISLTLEPRTILGKEVKHLRRDGKVPAVIHDHGKASLHVQGDSVTMLKVWKQAGKHHPVHLTTDKQTFVALIKDAAFDPKKHLLNHLVFNAVDKNQKVEAEIPIRPRYAEGNEASPAERNGLIVLSQLEAVQVRAIATALPDYLEYDAEKLVEVGDHATVADLTIPNGVEVEVDLDQNIATVYEPSALAAANDAAGGDAEEITEVSSDEASESTDGSDDKVSDESAKAPDSKNE